MAGSEPRAPPAKLERSIEVLPEHGVIEIRYRGPLSFRERIESLELIAPQVGADKLRRVLVDFTEAVEVPEEPGARGTYAARLATLPFRGCVVAFVNAPTVHSAPMEWVSVVVGYRIARFTQRDEALQWLVADGTRP